MWQGNKVILVGSGERDSLEAVVDQKVKVLSFIRALNNKGVDEDAIYFIGGNIAEKQAISRAAAESSHFPVSIWVCLNDEDRQVRGLMEEGKVLPLGIIQVPPINLRRQIAKAHTMTLVRMEIGDDEEEEEAAAESADGTDTKEGEAPPEDETVKKEPQQDSSASSDGSGEEDADGSVHKKPDTKGEKIETKEEKDTKIDREEDEQPKFTPVSLEEMEQAPSGTGDAAEKDPIPEQQASLKVQVERKAVVTGTSLNFPDNLGTPELKVDVEPTRQKYRGSQIAMNVYCSPERIESIDGRQPTFTENVRVGGSTALVMPRIKGKEMFVALQPEPPIGGVVFVYYGKEGGIPIPETATQFNVKFKKPSAPASVIVQEPIRITWPLEAEAGQSGAAQQVVGVLMLGNVRHKTQARVLAGSKSALVWELDPLSPGEYRVKMLGYGGQGAQEASLTFKVVTNIGGKISTTMTRVYGRILITGDAIVPAVKKLRRELIQADMPYQIIDMTEFGIAGATPAEEADASQNLVLYAVQSDNQMPGMEFHSILATGSGFQPVPSSLLADLQKLQGHKYMVSPREDDFFEGLEGWEFLKHEWKRAGKPQRGLKSIFGGRRNKEDDSILQYVALREERND